MSPDSVEFDADPDAAVAVQVSPAPRLPYISASTEFPFKAPYDPRFAERVPLIQCFRAAMTNAMAMHAVVRKEEGAFWAAECGVYRGRALRALALIADELGCPVQFVGLDSFEGLPDLTPTDLAAAPQGARYTREVLFADTTEREVLAYLADVNRDDRIVLVKGFFAQSLPTLPERRYAFVNIDCDLYEGHLQCLEYFYPRMLEGGIIFLDDYYSKIYPMARVAVDEFLVGKPEALFTVNYGAVGPPKACLIKA
jgi:hypothetical protein